MTGVVEPLALMAIASGATAAASTRINMPKVDGDAANAQQRALQEQRQALSEQEAANARRDADVKRRENATRRARGRTGRTMLLFDEVGLPPQVGATPIQTKLGA